MVIKKNKFHVVIVAILFFVTGIYGKQDQNFTKFPLVFISPNDKYEVSNSYNIGYNPNKAGKPIFPYKLLLIDRNSYKTEVLHEYSRNVAISWSPTSQYLIVNDYAGSDNADCLIFTIGDQIKKISIYGELQRQMPTNKTIFKQMNDPQHFNDHVYIICNKWLDNNKVLIKIYGHGNVDPDGFTLWYKYTLSAGFQLLKKENFINDGSFSP